MNCPLCRSTQTQVFVTVSDQKKYYHCNCCDLRFLDSSDHLSAEEEKARYLLHENDVDNPDYQKFVKPLIDQVNNHFTESGVAKDKRLGLDFGAGTAPVLAEQLKLQGYHVNVYDPYFWPDRGALNEQYDFIVSCEVIEHFFNPFIEFDLFKKMLKPGGVLGLMTMIYDSNLSFDEWFYRRDPTHVVFYSKKTFEWIAQEYKWGKPRISDERIILFNRDS